MELLTLPPEILCQILSQVNNTRDILSIFQTNNRYLINILRRKLVVTTIYYLLINILAM